MNKLFKLGTIFLASLSLVGFIKYNYEVSQKKDPVYFKVNSTNAVTFTAKDQNINSDAAAEIIFDNELESWDNDLVSINANRLKFALPQAAGSDIGFECRLDVTDDNQYQLYYDLKFDNDFSFAKGGKIGVGFAIGEGVSGGRNTEATIDNKGGSFRVMWRTTSDGSAYLHPYVYYKDMKTQFGTDYETSRYTIVANTTYRVRLTIKTNSSATLANGLARMEVQPNGSTSYTKVWEKTNIRWSGSTDSNNRKIKTLYLSAFRGGSDNTWDGKNVTNAIFIDNLNWKNSI
jgi:hypothetical protein